MKRNIATCLVGLLLSSILFLASYSSTIAADQSIQVDTTDDDPAKQACTTSPNDCSLRGAISKANADPANLYTIHIPTGTYTLDEPTSEEDGNINGDLDILVAINLVGEGMDQTIIQAGTSPETGIDRVIDLPAEDEFTVNISDLTVRHGNLPENSYLGAGIQLLGVDITLNLERVAVRDNRGGEYRLGGGIFSDGHLHAVDSQFTGNQVGYDGGGIYQAQSGTVHLERVLISGNSGEYGGGFVNGNVATIINSTISGNTASIFGGGISQWSNGTLSVHFSTITDNTNTGDSSAWAIYTSINWTLNIYNSIITAESGNKACNINMDDGQHNIGSDDSCGAGIQVTDPQLGPLADHGGNTLTHALLAGSPAINAAGGGGNSIPCPTVDQRNFPRPFNIPDRCDIGAFEVEGYHLYVPVLFSR